VFVKCFVGACMRTKENVLLKKKTPSNIISEHDIQNRGRLCVRDILDTRVSCFLYNH
jgi:hypothetical protein